MTEENGHDERLARDMADAQTLRGNMRIPEEKSLAEGVEEVVGNAAQQIQILQQQTGLMGQNLAVLGRLRDTEAPEMLLKLAVALCGKGKSMPTWAEMLVAVEDLRKRAEDADGSMKDQLKDIQKRLADLVIPGPQYVPGATGPTSPE